MSDFRDQFAQQKHREASSAQHKETEDVSHKNIGIQSAEVIDKHNTGPTAQQNIDAVNAPENLRMEDKHTNRSTQKSTRTTMV